MSKYNKHNELTLEQFLFGDDNFFPEGDPYRAEAMEGMHCVGRDFDFEDSEENFKAYKDNIIYCCTDLGWDTDEGITVDHSGNSIQKFDIPRDEIIREFYETQKKRWVRDE